MPSSRHEVLVEIFRQRPSLVVELLTGALGVDLPEYRQASLEPAECVDIAPTEYRADAVVVLSDSSGPVRAVVVEVQLRRDDDKRWTWPLYVTTLRARLRCPTLLLVVCVDHATEAWCAAPIGIGEPGSVVIPLVIGPDRVPVVTAVDDVVHAPELTVLSALAHGADPDRRGVLDALVGALATIDQNHAVLYAELVLAALPAAARRHLEALMKIETFEFQSEYARKLRVEGRVEGRAEAKAADVLTVLDARGLAVPDDVRAHITGCSDLDQLDMWLRRAVTTGSVQDLFD